MDRYEIRQQLLENARKMQAIFDEACKNGESFEIAAYSEEINRNYSAVLEDMRAEYEERALNRMAAAKEAEA